MEEAQFRAAARVEARRSTDRYRSTDSLPLSTDLWRLVLSLVIIPARSLALVMEESREGFRLAGNRASAVASTAAEVSEGAGVAEVTRAEVIGNPVDSWKTTLRNGERNHEYDKSD
jgi:hypothetical protein